ncbi:MAG: class I SAM-dependent methyltransferase, partial [Deltaproteobacteria bacterium]
MSSSLEVMRGASEHYDDAGYYDHTYRLRTEDIAFYRRIARLHGGPVLEIGGGSGRISLALARDGHDVDVVDTSRSMLARGQARALAGLRAAEGHGRVEFRHGDMRAFALGKKFPLVLAPFNTLLHLYEPDDFAACFRTVVAHLAPGGAFVFDVRVPNLRELCRDPGHVYRSRGFRHPTLGYRV